MTSVCCTVERASSSTDILLTDFNDVTTAAAALEVEVEFEFEFELEVMESFLFTGGIVVCDDDEDDEEEEEDDCGGKDGVGENGYFCSV
jgi:hypothetical protein